MPTRPCNVVDHPCASLKCSHLAGELNAILRYAKPKFEFCAKNRHLGTQVSTFKWIFNPNPAQSDVGHLMHTSAQPGELSNGTTHVLPTQREHGDNYDFN